MRVRVPGSARCSTFIDKLDMKSGGDSNASFEQIATRIGLPAAGRRVRRREDCVAHFSNDVVSGGVFRCRRSVAFRGERQDWVEPIHSERGAW